MKRAVFAAVCLFMFQADAIAQEGSAFRVLATSRTSTMQKEMQAAGDAGFRFAAVMGGETAVGGKEVVVVMQRSHEDAAANYEYRLGETTIGGTELVAIARRRLTK